MVSSVVEQVYRSTFKFCLLKIQELCPLKRFIFTSKCTKMHLVAGLRPDPLGEFTALPNPLAGKGGEEGEWGRRGKRERKEEKGDPRNV